MKPCYEGLKEIRVDVNDIWRKMLCFRVGIGLLPLILIVSWNEKKSELMLWRKMLCFRVNPLILIVDEGLKEIRVDVNDIWRKMLCFRVSIGLLPLILIVSWNPVMKVWKKSELMSMKENVVKEKLCFRVSIGLLPLILIVSWNETLLWRFERNQSWCQWDMKENVVF